jgi:hypothetical protein
MTKPQALRLTVHGEHLDAADNLAERLPHGSQFSGLVLSRNDVLRIAVARGLEQLLADLDRRGLDRPTEGAA